MPNTDVFKTEEELTQFLIDYLRNHNNTIAIIKRDLRKDIVQALLSTEDFDKYKDISDLKENVLFIIKTGHKRDRTLSLKVCDAYNQDTKVFKMVDIENVLILSGLVSEDDEKTITYYKQLIRLKLS